MTSILYIVIAILMLGLLILVHELGHYITGRLLGFKINEFSVGMGPKLISRSHKGIVYSLRAIPMGGFVAFCGEDEGEETDPRAMNNMPWYKRAVVMFAGAGFNILFALLITAILTCAIGYYAPSIVTVNEASGFNNVVQENDIIIEINDRDVVVAEIISKELNKVPYGETVKLTVLRNGEKVKLEATGMQSTENGMHVLGITYRYAAVNQNIFQAIGYSFKYNVYMTGFTYETLWRLVTGQESLSNVTGPISTIGQISNVVGESAGGEYAVQLSVGERTRQTLVTILQLLVIISNNLAVMNLLPFPALDGFRFVSAIVEGITKKHLPRKVEGIINTAGLFVLVGLMIALEISKLFN